MVEAFERALEEIDAGERTRAAADDDEEVVWEYSAPARQGPRPDVPRGLPITQYDHRQLVALARWIQSDTLLRTEDQLIGEMMDELGFKRRGSRIVEALTRAIRDA